MARHAGVVTKFKSRRRKAGTLHCDVCGWFPPVGLARVSAGLHTMMHAHHVIPVACGGDDAEANLVLLCPNCHSVAHRLGTISPAKGQWPEFTWSGPRTPKELLNEMDLLILQPRAWEEREDRRRDARIKAEVETRANAEHIEALERRKLIKVTA
jgi:hypothetical protein